VKASKPNILTFRRKTLI